MNRLEREPPPMHTEVLDSQRQRLPRQSPFTLLLRALVLLVRGRIHARRRLKRVTQEDHGEKFVAFRKVVVDPAESKSSCPGAIFKVRFRFRNLPSWANRLLSLTPIPLIVAQPGFRSKTWLLGQDSGDFMGYYEFDTTETAKAYRTSLPMRMMQRRASPDSLSIGIHQS